VLERDLVFQAGRSFDGGHALAGMGNARAQHFDIVGENMAALAPARDTHIELLLTNRSERT